MNPMILSQAECERKVILPGLTTAIIATCQSKIECLMWSVFSLLLRSTQKLEHIIVSINGPDKRTGDPGLQDRKQAFLEELRSMKWEVPLLEHNRDMPLTVIRTWSRIGHSQATDMAIPWVHTEFYTIMHDDIIINTSSWCDGFNAFEDKEVGMIYAQPMLSTGLSWVNFDTSRKINLPHLNSMFITSRKELYTEMGLRWYGYHLKKDFDFKNTNEFSNFHKDEITHMPSDGSYGYVSMDVGAWILYKMKKAGYKFVPLPDNTVTHLCAMSWRDQDGQNTTINNNKKVIGDLIEEIYRHKDLKRLYQKYIN